MAWLPRPSPALLPLNLFCSCGIAARGHFLLVQENTSFQPSLSQDSSISQPCKHTRRSLCPAPGSVIGPRPSLCPRLSSCILGRTDQQLMELRPLTCQGAHMLCHRHCWTCVQCPSPRLGWSSVCSTNCQRLLAASISCCQTQPNPHHLPFSKLFQLYLLWRELF